MSETLLASARTVFGKKTASQKKMGKIPAVLYGPDAKEPISLFIDSIEFQKLFGRAHHNTPITIEVDVNGKKEKHTALIHDVTSDPVKGGVTHVDFYQFSAKKKIHISIPVVLKGEAPAQKLGALIMKNVETVDIECSPLHIPEHVLIDISGLTEFDQTIYARDIVMPEGVHMHLDAHVPVVSVVPPLSEAELAAMETKTKEPLKEPELVGKKEKPEEAEAQETAKSAKGGK